MALRTILVVDDDADIRSLTELALTRGTGWRVLLADSGTEALEVARREQPDLILLDVLMPDLDGPAIFEALQSSGETRGIPVVMTTAQPRRELEALAELGCPVVRKPFDPITLPDELRRIASSHAERAP